MNRRPTAIVAVDAGTSALRVVAFDPDGRRLAHFSRPNEIRRGVDGSAEQDPLVWVAALDAGLREVTAALADHEVAAIAVTSQRATVIAVDAAGEPVFPALSWRDRRGADDAARLAAEIGEERIYARTGLRVDAYFTAAKLAWLGRERPEADARARWYLSVQDFLAHHLSGEVGTESTQASRTMLFDADRNAWDPELIAATGIDPGRLPDPAPPGSRLGSLRDSVARQAGLPGGIPVVLAGGDQQCGALGLGVVAPGRAGVTVSSGSFVVAPVERSRRDPERRVLCSPAAVPGQWVLEAGVQTAMSTLSWLLRTLDRGDAATEVDAALGDSPPGAAGVVVLPHFNGIAAPYWDPRARGAILGLTEAHRPADLVRAALEGIAIDVRRNLRVLGPLLGEGIAMSELRAGGGGARSDRFNQLQADAYGTPVVPVTEPEAAALGAAIQAAVATGLHADHAAAATAMVQPDEERRALPRAEQTVLYAELAATHERLLPAISTTAPTRAADEEEAE